MTNALYKVSPGQTTPPLASDQTQFVDTLNANADVGAISFAPSLAAPSNAGITAAAAAGSALGTGQYYYNFTYVTGIIKSDNATVISGETLPSTSISVTTTAGSQAVTISGMPTVNNWPVTAIGFRIYRTLVGGADGTQKLVTTFYTNYARSTSQTSYTDTTADASLGAAVPTVNTTGTSLGTNQTLLQIGALELNTDTRSTTLTYDGNNNLTTVTEKDGATTVRTTSLTYTSGNLTTVTETAGARTITTTLNYDGNNNLTSITKTVS